MAVWRRILRARNCPEHRSFRGVNRHARQLPFVKEGGQRRLAEARWHDLAGRSDSKELSRQGTGELVLNRIQQFNNAFFFANDSLHARLPRL
jgi:hypothetical protein